MFSNNWGFPRSSAGKESTCYVGEPGSIPGSGRSPGEGVGYPLQYSWASLMVQMVTNPPSKRHGFDPWVRKILWTRKWQPTPVFLPWKICRQRSLAGYSPWGHKDLDMTEELNSNNSIAYSMFVEFYICYLN